MMSFHQCLTFFAILFLYPTLLVPMVQSEDIKAAQIMLDFSRHPIHPPALPQQLEYKSNRAMISPSTKSIAMKEKSHFVLYRVFPHHLGCGYFIFQDPSHQPSYQEQKKLEKARQRMLSLIMS